MKTRWTTLVLLITAAAMAAEGTSWPTLHRDNQRSGWTDEVVGGSLERKWFRNFVDEMIGARVEAIVAEGKVFVGTYAGNLYALDATDGKTLWTYKAAGPIGHSPCYSDGKVYAASDDAFNAGSVFCINAADGQEVWKTATPAGVFNAPATDGKKVYVGDRGGAFHALDAATGAIVWSRPTGYMILKPASISSDGKRIIVGSEDMHVYCFSPDGELLWKSPKLPGLSLRDQAATIWGDKVIVRTNPPAPFHESLREGRDVMKAAQRQIPVGPDDKVIQETGNIYYLRRTDAREKAENTAGVAYLRAHPDSKTFHVLNLSDGKEAFIAPVFFTVGMHNPPTAPCFNPNTGTLYTLIVTSLSPYYDGVSQVGVGVGTMDPKTGYVTNLGHAMGDRVPGYWGGFTGITDETSTLTIMGDFLVSTHQGAVGGTDLKTLQHRQLHGARDSYGGIFGPGVTPGSWDGSTKLAAEGYVQNTINEWHGPDRSCVSVAAGRMFWVAGGQVVCFAGRDVEPKNTGATKAPEPFKHEKMPRINGGNLTSGFGEYDKSIQPKAFKAAELAKYLADPKPAAAATGPLADELRARLDATVTELIDGGPWAPWTLQLGIANEEAHFWRSAETMQTVACALPQLSPAVRTKAVAYLDKLFADGAPLREPVIDKSGARREAYDMPARRARGGPDNYVPGVKDLYALWAYAHHADRWDRVKAQTGAVRAACARSMGRPVRLNAANLGNAAADANAQIAGLIGYVRLMRHFGDSAAADKALPALTALVSHRVHHELADSRLQTHREHHASIPRYLGLTPELGAILADHAGQTLKTNLDDLRRELPVFYQAWSERLIGGENYITPPGVARGIFGACAYSGLLGRGDLARYLDQPWTKADLYYIEKLSATLTAK